MTGAYYGYSNTVEARFTLKAGRARLDETRRNGNSLRGILRTSEGTVRCDLSADASVLRLYDHR